MAEAFSFFYDIFIPFLLLFATLFSICFLFESNRILFAVIFLIFSFSVGFRPSRFKSTVAVTALIFGTLGEWVCCYFDLWVYANPSFYRLPIWLPMIWPILMISFGRLSQGFRTCLDKAGTWQVWLFKLLGLFVSIYAVYTFVQINAVISAIFILFFILMLLFARSRFNLIYFIVAAIGGCFGEIACMQFDVWYYTNPMFPDSGVPLSLPLAWGLSANIIWLISRWVSGTYKAAKVSELGFH